MVFFYTQFRHLLVERFPNHLIFLIKARRFCRISFYTLLGAGALNLLDYCWVFDGTQIKTNETVKSFVNLKDFGK